MKIVIIGGTGLIGKKLGARLRERGHDVTSASPSSGVNAVTGEGVREALAGADVVVDVSNSPSFDDEAVLKFFEASTRNLLAAEREAGVAHHVALSVVGSDRLPESGYMRAKVAQEKLIQAGAVRYTIVRATQFFEFLGAIGDSVAANGEVRLPAANMQPMAADDVASALAEIAVAPPANEIVEIAGPEPLSMGEAVGRVLAAKGDRRKVVADADAAYFGARLQDDSLTPQGKHPRLAATTLQQWLNLA